MSVFLDRFLINNFFFLINKNIYFFLIFYIFMREKTRLKIKVF
jgi:hypothetical protein